MKQNTIKIERPKRFKNQVPILTAEEAVGLIPDNAVLFGGGDGLGDNEPAMIYRQIRKSFNETGRPRNLTLIHSGGLGDKKAGSPYGFNPLAVPGLITKEIAGLPGDSRDLALMINNNDAEGYILSMGTISMMMRVAAARQPGFLSKVGLGTYIDPREMGGRYNASAKDELSRIMEIDGEEYIYYKTIFPDVTILRGTTADTEGYISCEEESLPRYFEDLSCAQAAHNNGGLVIAQVKRIVQAGSIKPYDVRIPGIFVDAVVVDPDQFQDYAGIGKSTDFFSTGDLRATTNDVIAYPLNERKVIARRALLEAKQSSICNVGSGIMFMLAGIAYEEGVTDQFTVTVETGDIGSTSGPSGNNPKLFCRRNSKAVIPMPDMFGFYEGGGLDMAFLSFAEIDREGNVNVHKIGDKILGNGGFIHITTCTKATVFGGTMTTGGIKVEVRDNKIRIVEEGKFRKFPKKLEQITFNAKNALKEGRKILYVTERCVFRLTPEGIELIEIAEGMNVERDILPLMDFVPLIARDLKIMDPRIFNEGPMGIGNLKDSDRS